jgi:hypothetical protein
MIDLSFIIKYTNALYSTDPADAPRYDEFRDMFSSGQIRSKEWVLKELERMDPIHQDKSFIVTGAWFGTLGMMIKWQFPTVRVAMLDIDPRCERFIQNIIYDNKDLRSITGDMYRYSYCEDVIINTSCEHIDNVREWLDILPKDRTVVLQSNNYLEGNGHVNCVSSTEQFIKQTGLQNIIYSGELVMPMYTRYMIIGKT